MKRIQRHLCMFLQFQRLVETLAFLLYHSVASYREEAKGRGGEGGRMAVRGRRGNG